LLIRKIVRYRKQKMSGDNGILGPVATCLCVNNCDTLSRDWTLYFRTDNIYDADPFESDG
jgi:hypothetical protein